MTKMKLPLKFSNLSVTLSFCYCITKTNLCIWYRLRFEFKVEYIPFCCWSKFKIFFTHSFVLFHPKLPPNLWNLILESQSLKLLCVFDFLNVVNMYFLLCLCKISIAFRCSQLFKLIITQLSFLRTEKDVCFRIKRE